MTGNDLGEQVDAGPPTTSSPRSSFRDEWGNEATASTRVVDAIAAVTGTSPKQHQPLYETIDPDALDRLLETASDNRCTTTVSFGHEGCAVTITADGQLTVTPRTDDR